MFYRSETNDHGLPRDPFKSLIVPRPIGWVSSVSADGHLNLAPYSFFNGISDKPHYVYFGSQGIKDSLDNVRETGEFVCSMATYEMRNQQNITSVAVPPDVDEFSVAGLETVKSETVKPPRVKGAPIAFECKLWKTFDLPATVPGGKPGYTIVLGYIQGIYIDDAYIKDGYVQTAAMQPIARLGYMDYAVINDANMFTIQRPVVADDGSISVPENPK